MNNPETHTGSDLPDIYQTINKALDKARDIGYNQGVEGAIREVEAEIEGVVDSVLWHSLNELISKLQALKK